MMDEDEEKEKTEEKDEPKKKIKGKGGKLSALIDKSLSDRPDTDYNMWKKIMSSPLRKKTGNPIKADREARKFLESKSSTTIAKSDIKPGMMIMFHYFKPKTEEKLEYFDAWPCVLFFGEFNCKEGRRVLGFNLHYYPPKLRYRILSWLFDHFKETWAPDWDDEAKPNEIDDFDYNTIMGGLSKAGLEFGVREYIPTLMGDVTKIAPKMFEVAVFTEGVFQKETRTQILRYWKDKKNGKF